MSIKTRATPMRIIAGCQFARAFFGKLLSLKLEENEEASHLHLVPKELDS